MQELDTHDVHMALFSRMEMAFRAARLQGLPGSFDAWRGDGVFATCATAADLRFLSAIVLSKPPTEGDLRETIADSRWGGQSPDIVVGWGSESPAAESLRALGYAEYGMRPLAIHRIGADSGDGIDGGGSDDLLVEAVAADAIDDFVSVLLAGYETIGHVARFIEGEHREPGVQRFAVQRMDRMIAVAGMTMHGGVAVLGGAATLPEARGKGAQGALLRHRLAVARQTGCDLAVATAAPSSPSLRNLERSGFQIHNRVSWRMASEGGNHDG